MQKTQSLCEKLVQHDPLISEIEILIDQDGPRPAQYPYADYLFEALGKKIAAAKVSTQALGHLLNRCSFLHTNQSVMGHIRNKPYGYAGDFMIIERIYLNKPNPVSAYYNWDRYSLSHVAAKAVRNRKDYFKSVMARRIQKAARPLQLLDVASGPARDLKELFDNIGPGSLTATCVEMDKRAIEHASLLNAKYINHIHFINENIFRFQTNERFDIVWSAGLFDYFDDRGFIMVLKKLMHCTADNGELIIGNFNDENPSRKYMEVVGDWILNHRSAAHLKALALAAGAKPGNIWVGQEPEGINLFLHIRKG